MSQALAESYPPLGKYWPRIDKVSAKQAIFLFHQGGEAFYGGAAGGGKSDALFAAAIQYADVPGYQALILRRSFADLALPGAIMARSLEYLGGHPEVHWSQERKTFTFPSGATLTFGYMQTDADMTRYQSAEFQYVAYDELSQFSEKQYLWLYSRQRATEDVNVPLRMRSASNPGGIGHGWVMKRFINDATRPEGVVFVPAKLDDHPDEKFRDGYRKSLAHLDEVTRRRLEDGDWSVGEGLAFMDWDERVHVIDDLDVTPIPASFERFECMDYGTTNPTAWYLIGIDYDGNLIVADELYGPNKHPDGKPKGGIVSEIAPLVLERRKLWWEPVGEDGWKISTNRVWADPSIRNTEGIAGMMGTRTSVQQEFTDLGVAGIVPANNDRRAGYLRLAELIRRDRGDEHSGRSPRRFPAWHQLAGQDGSPGLFVNRRCTYLIEQLASAPLEVEKKPLYGEAIAGDWESRHGHAVAALRYGALSRPGASKEPEPELDDPRAAMLARRRKARTAPLRERETEYLEL